MKKSKLLSWVLVIFVLCQAAGCTKEDPVNPADVAEVASDGNSFALDLYPRLAEGNSNFIFSPYSIVSAFGMIYAGAGGETAKEMEKAMHFSLGQDRLHPAVGFLSRDLNKRGKGGGFDISVANRLWGRKGIEFQKPYLDLVKKHYRVSMDLLDFSDPAPASRVINRWVEKQTDGKITGIVSPDALNADTRLVLVNAIYFKAKWEKEFEKRETSVADFTLSGGDTTSVALMEQQQEFGYAALPGLQILEMDYKGAAISMVILLPETFDGLPALEKELSADNLSAWIAAISPQWVSVYIPKFKFESAVNLRDRMQDLGMKSLFSLEAADLTGIDGTRELFISDALHKAFIAVDEEGTEAAAATVMMGVGAAPPGENIFRADHPFIFLIRDKSSGAILFMGRVMDPR